MSKNKKAENSVKFYATLVINDIFINRSDGEIEEKDCPKWDSNQITKGIIRSANTVVHMFSNNNPRSHSSPISFYYCSNCGYVLGLFVENPHILEE
ncbi:acetyltransferase [Niallia sp. RD1]|uniref:acetyltransferase n=1 Tax=Niallia sp. RD1 TaxID=2962858 RepID=UPI0020C19107|nr:acetyltransferase [Niallia sp. RD1]UTI44170.1 acetyltransferase [Niallia sp. RD1]